MAANSGNVELRFGSVLTEIVLLIAFGSAQKKELRMKQREEEKKRKEEEKAKQVISFLDPNCLLVEEKIWFSFCFSFSAF